jgi:hypothetical protein
MKNFGRIIANRQITSKMGNHAGIHTKLTSRTLWHCRHFSTQKEPETTLVQVLKKAIHIQGPLTLAQFMRLSLTSAQEGYYQRGDVFGTSGDFITAPEVSQMMGELIAIWFVTQWNALGMPKRISLVELGPGRGTLMADVLRVR